MPYTDELRLVTCVYLMLTVLAEVIVLVLSGHDPP